MHINEKELLAVLKGLRFLYSSQSNVTLLIKSDNMTTMSYINKQGCCKSSMLNEIARSIWLWAMKRSIFIVSSPSPIPGKEKIQADSLFSLMKLNGCLIELFLKAFFFPEVDLMATAEISNICFLACRSKSNCL